MNTRHDFRPLLRWLFDEHEFVEGKIMEDGSEAGFNRTGAQSSPLSVHSMQLYADERVPEEVFALDELPGGKEIAAVRGDYAIEADRIGSVPMPGVLTSAFTAVLSKVGARKPEVLVDKLGERLAFERIGVRLYQALIDKASALARQQPLPFSIDALQRLRDDELAHMHVLASALDSLGADSTAQTPAANVSAVAISGLMQVLTDPRTTLVHCLEAILIAELADDASWDLLISLTEEVDQDQFLPQFCSARDTEKAHVRQIRSWLQAVVLGEAH